jgi:hypothetical protein
MSNLYDISIIPPPPRLHRTSNVEHICNTDGCEKITWNICGYCVECYPENGSCNPSGHWSSEEKIRYYARLKAHDNWNFLCRLLHLKKYLRKYIFKIAERIYSPGEIGYLKAKSNWEKSF